METENVDDSQSFKTVTRSRKRKHDTAGMDVDGEQTVGASSSTAGQPGPSNEVAKVTDTGKQRVKAASISAATGSSSKRPNYAPLTFTEGEQGNFEMRKVPIPPNRITPLKNGWKKLFATVVEHLRLQVRFNVRTRNVELRTCADTRDCTSLQRGADFVRAFALGFEMDDAIALVRLDSLFIDSFEISDVRATLRGDHLARAIGRIAGHNGRTRFAIENATRTRIVLADSKVHLLGAFENIALARTAICNLILGAPPAKVYGTLRNVVTKVSQRF